MIKVIPPQRILDSWGAGHYGASRGSRTHKGIDFNCSPDSLVLSNTDGVVTKLGYPYSDDLSFRYVQITTHNNEDYRFYYVEPSVKKGQTIKEGDIIGSVQDLTKRYEGINNHCHFEVKVDGEHVDPEPYL